MAPSAVLQAAREYCRGRHPCLPDERAPTGGCPSFVRAVQDESGQGQLEKGPGPVPVFCDLIFSKFIHNCSHVSDKFGFDDPDAFDNFNALQLTDQFGVNNGVAFFAP